MRGQSALEEQLDCARLILDEALRAGETDTHAALYAVQQDGEETTLVFMQLYGGVPVLGDSDFATFRFADNGTLTSATTVSYRHLVVRLPIAEVEQMIVRDEIRDAKTMAALYRAKLKGLY